jgi:transposase
MMFNEDSLRDDIQKVWGEHGAHVEVFDFMLDRIAKLERQVRDLTAAVEAYDWEANNGGYMR